MPNILKSIEGPLQIHFEFIYSIRLANVIYLYWLPLPTPPCARRAT